MRSSRHIRATVIAALTLSTLSLAGEVSSAPAQVGPTSASAPSFPRTATFVARRSGWLRLHLRRPAQVDIRERFSAESGPNPNARMEGKGRFIGLVIIQEPVENHDPLVIGRFGRCAGQGCKGAAMNVVMPSASAVGRRYLDLKPGFYRIFVVLDGSPATIELQLRGKGLSGRKTLHPTTSFESKQWSLPPVNTPALLTGSGTVPTTVTDQSIILSTVWFDARQTGSAAGDCLYDSSELAMTNGPACGPLAETGATGGGAVQSFGPSPSSPATERTTALRIGRFNPPAGQWNYGLWFASSTPVNRLGGTTAVVSF